MDDQTLRLNGTDASVVVQGVPTGITFTAEIWARSETDTWNEDGILLSSRDDSGFILHPNKGTKDVDVYLVSSAPATFPVKVAASFHVDDITEWHHYAFVYDLYNYSETCKLYLDGVLVGTAVHPYVSRYVNKTVNVSVGNDFTNRYGNIEVDEVRFWNTARSAADISKNMNRALAGNEPGLVRYLNFDSIPATAVGGYTVGTRPAKPFVAEEDGPVLLPKITFTDGDAISDTDLYSVALSVYKGALNLERLPSIVGLTLTDGSNDSPSMTLSGTRDMLTDALQKIFYRPNLVASGSDTLNVTVTDSGSADDRAAASAVFTLPIPIFNVNDAPTFNLGTNLSVKEGSERQTVAGFATAMSTGSPDEAQSLTFITTNSKPALFLEQPAVDSSGTLTYRPQPNVHGTATVSVSLKDDGGTAYGGVDTATHTFTITVDQYNHSPMIGTTHALRFNGTDSYALASNVWVESYITLEFWARSPTPTWNENGFLLSSRGREGIIFHPNKGGTSVNVYMLNRQRTNDLTVVNAFQPVDITQWHHYAFVYSLEPGASIAYYKVYLDGELVRQGFDSSPQRDGDYGRYNNFYVGMDDPSGSGTAGRYGAADIDEVRIWNRALSGEEISDNLMWKPTGTEPGLALYLDMENRSGNSVPDLAGGDQNGVLSGNATQALNPYVADPSLNVGFATVEDQSAAFAPVEIEDRDAADGILTAELVAEHGTLTVPSEIDGLTLEAGAIGSSSLVYSGAEADLNAMLDVLAYTPDDDFYGTDTVTLTVTDIGNGQPNDVKSTTQVYTVDVQAVNDAPSFTPGADQQVETDAGVQTVSGWATNVSAGPAEDDDQQVTFLVSNDNTGLFVQQPAIDRNGTLSYKATPGAVGEAEVTVALTDDGGTGAGGVDTSASITFTITVVPKAPTLTVGSAIIAEAAANDGTITAKQVITLANGTFVADVTGGMTVNRLPAGLGVSVTRDSDTQLTVAFTGQAAHHENVDDVGNASVTVAQAFIVGATGQVTSNAFAFDFANAVQAPEPPDTDEPETPPTTPVDPGSPPTNPSDTTASFNVYLDQDSDWTLSNKVKVVVPAGAVKQDGTMHVTVVPPNEIPSLPSLPALSEVFEFSSSTNRTFLKPIEITFFIDSHPSTDSHGPAVYYYNERLKRWIYVGGILNADGTLTVYVNHFTKFAVFDDQVALFPDLSKHWAAPYAARLIGMKAINGYSDGLFHPEDNVTRAEFAKMLAEALSLHGEYDLTEFKDNPSIPAWARASVAAVMQTGLMNGYEANGARLFKPDQLISRAEMSVVLANALKTFSSPSGHNASITFTDAGLIPTWARASIEAVSASNLMQGNDTGAFRPFRSATRAEAAATIYRLLEALYI
ncbi:S-layer homology domain-containing protein [Cohnella yongneupensis]|uniref:S-layer homology domain-containing protein n=1 Tax=Cohnella yongneupensis TaxID=425006 RepID=A0ABW0QWY6_9BACL